MYSKDKFQNHMKLENNNNNNITIESDLSFVICIYDE